MPSLSGGNPIGTASFRQNSIIRLFNELELFINIQGWTSADGYFTNCTNLEEIVFPCPTSNKTLPRSMFSGCSKLKKIIIKEGVTRINGWFFFECTSLVYIELPSTLSVFGAATGNTYTTFQNVPSGCSVILKATTPPTATNNVFNRFYGKFYVPDKSIEAYKAATGWSSIASRIFPLSEYE